MLVLFFGYWLGWCVGEVVRGWVRFWKEGVDWLGSFWVLIIFDGFVFLGVVEFI